MIGIIIDAGFVTKHSEDFPWLYNQFLTFWRPPGWQFSAVKPPFRRMDTLAQAKHRETFGTSLNDIEIFPMRNIWTRVDRFHSFSFIFLNFHLAVWGGFGTWCQWCRRGLCSTDRSGIFCPAWCTHRGVMVDLWIGVFWSVAYGKLGNLGIRFLFCFEKLGMCLNCGRKWLSPEICRE